MKPVYTGCGYTLRPLAPAEWPLYKAIRLEALATDPALFGSSLASASVFPDNEWKRRLESPLNAIWGLFFEEAIIGLTGIFINANAPSEATLTHSFIRPEHRGKGLSELFYGARIKWAKDKGLKQLIVSHRAGNAASRAANQRAGFRYTHSELKTWPDGSEAPQLFYMMKL